MRDAAGAGGKALGGYKIATGVVGKALKVAKAKKWFGRAVGTSAVFYPKMAENTELDLLEAGMDPANAAFYGRASGLIQAAVEVLEMNPLYRDGAKQVKGAVTKRMVAWVMDYTQNF